MIANSKSIKIDISQVLALGKQTHPQFLPCLADVEAKLSDPDELRAICIHEAAHLFYMTKAGMRDPEFTGPKIIYNSAKDDFDRYGASVRCPNRDDAYLSTITVGHWAFQIAKAHAAGGVAVRVLTNRPDIESGDSEDRENFNKAYALLCAEFPDQTIKDEDMWTEAQRILGLELQEKPRQDYILSLAERIKSDLFKPEDRFSHT